MYAHNLSSDFDQTSNRVSLTNIKNESPMQQRRPAGVSTNDIGEEIVKLAEEDVHHSVSDEVFSSYQHVDIIPGCKAHPGDIVEAGSLAAIPPPEPWYPLADSLPSSLITAGSLSSLQLTGVLYACQRLQLLLPGGSRAGFFLGDAAGVGKGRQVAGIILDNCARGRNKHVWFSISTDLIVDARRDLADIGCHVKVIEGCQQLDRETRVFGLPAGFKNGVIFSTYSTLVSSVQKSGSSRQSRLQQLIDWCGGAEFDGCLIFDECHKAKNFVPGNEGASTKVAVAVAGLQQQLPRARVLYCSATGVTDVSNMAFMERLGLWGPGATFRSFEQFVDTVTQKGLGVAELLAMEMKSQGMYLARGLSFAQTQFEKIEISLTEEQMKMYNVAAHLWSEVRKSLEHAVDRCGAPGRVWATYWAAHQRFFKQLCIGMKVPKVVAMTREALEAGYCVVIGLQTTGEASLESELSSGNQPSSGFVSLCRDILKKFIDNNFPTVVQDKTHGSPEDDWSVTAKQMLLGFTQQIELPNSPLDELLDLLGGPGQVAEMTGRRGRVVRSGPGQPLTYQPRTAAAASDLESLNVQERNEFQSGRKLVAIISDAASTGVSLHADMRASNTRRRVHITLELPWSADKAVQQMGRSHRSNQLSGPLYMLLTTDLGSERRFAAAVARRLQSLGALTKGDRRAASGANLDEFHVDTPYGRRALRSMYDSICRRQMAPGLTIGDVTTAGDFQLFNNAMQDCLATMGILETSTLTSKQKVKDSLAGNVGLFLNRILGLKVEKQNMIFQYFTQCLEALIASSKREGRYSEGLVDITGSSVELVGQPRRVFQTDNQRHPTYQRVVQVDRGMSWEQAMARLGNHPGAENGFYCSRKDVRGKRFHLLATLKPGSAHTYTIARPGTGVSPFDEQQEDLERKYSRLEPSLAEAGWKDQYDSSGKSCIHGHKCRNGATCNVGSRCYRVHLLCGGVVTLLSLLETTLSKYGPQLSLTKAEQTLRVVRVQLSTGQRLVGVRFPEALLLLAERDFRLQQTTLTALQNPALNSASQSLNSQPAGAGSALGVTGDENPADLAYVMEAVTAVNERSLARATAPPLTITSFFKPKQAAPSDATATRAPPSAEMENSENGDTPTNCDNTLSDTLPAKVLSSGKLGSTENCDNTESQSDAVTQQQNTNRDSNLSNNNNEKPTAESSCDVLSSDRLLTANGVNTVTDTKVTEDESLPCDVIAIDSESESPSKFKDTQESKVTKRSIIDTTKTPSNPFKTQANGLFSWSESSKKSNSFAVSNNTSTGTSNFSHNVLRSTSNTPTQPRKRALDTSAKTSRVKRGRGASGVAAGGRGGGGSGSGATQTSLLTCFARVRTQQENRSAGAQSCPICGTGFKHGASNESVNKHIDSCLIE